MGTDTQPGKVKAHLTTADVYRLRMTKAHGSLLRASQTAHRQGLT